MIIFVAFLLLPFEECPPIREKPRLVVFEFQGIGVEKELNAIVSDLFRVELTECPRYRVIHKEVMQAVLGDTLGVRNMDEIKEKSALLKAKFAVTGRITQLGTKIILSVSLIDARNKVAIFTDKLTSSTVEDLEIVIKRLSDALCTMEKAKTKVTVETITQEEAKPKLRRQSYHTVGIFMGTLMPIARSYGRKVEGEDYYYWDWERRRVRLGNYISQMLGYGFSYLYETSYYMAEVTAKVYTESESAFLGFIFSGYKFLSLEDFSPFWGGGLGMGRGTRVTGVDSTWREYDSTWRYEPKREDFDGLIVEIGGGFMFFRTYDFHFILNLKLNIMFAEEIISGVTINFGISYKSKERGCCGL
jgi:TolB-like protein